MTSFTLNLEDAELITLGQREPGSHLPDLFYRMYVSKRTGDIYISLSNQRDLNRWNEGEKSSIPAEATMYAVQFGDFLRERHISYSVGTISCASKENMPDPSFRINARSADPFIQLVMDGMYLHRVDLRSYNTDKIPQRMFSDSEIVLIKETWAAYRERGEAGAREVLSRPSGSSSAWIMG